MAESFGTWLATARAGKMSQRQLASAIGRSHTWVSDLEKEGYIKQDGKPTLPDREMVERIARALEVPVEEALLAAGYAPPEAQANETVNRIASNAKHLSPKFQERLLEIARLFLSWEKKDLKELPGGRKPTSKSRASLETARHHPDKAQSGKKKENAG